MKLAIIGNKDAILGFKALGVSTFTIQNQTEGERALAEIKNAQNYAAIFITEDWAEKLAAKLKTFQDSPLPAIVAIPTQHGTTGYGLRRLKKIVEQAVGSDILFKE